MILGVPILDTLFAIVRRAARRQGFATADKGHLHHRLMNLGHGQRRSVLILWLWTALLSALVLYPVFTTSGATLATLGVLALGLGLFTVLHPGGPKEPGAHATNGGSEIGKPESRPIRIGVAGDRTLDCSRVHKLRDTGVMACERHPDTPMDRTPKKPIPQTATGDGLARGMEFALLTLLFLGIGYALDRWFGTKPVFMIILVVVSVVGQFASLWYGYDERMKQHEAERAGNARGQAGRQRTGKAAIVMTYDDNSPTASPMTTRLDGAAPEVEISADMIRRGLIVGPLLDRDLRCHLGHGRRCLVRLRHWRSCSSTSRIAAGLIAVTARISLGLMMGAILFGYLIRLGLVLLAFLLVKDAGWMSRPALGVTVIVTHLGLLVWELRYVAASLAYPGLKPISLELTGTGPLCSDSNSPRSTKSFAGRTSLRPSTRSR